jgi:hypothetical protein
MKPSQLRRLLLAATIPLLFIYCQYISIAISQSSAISQLSHLIDSPRNEQANNKNLAATTKIVAITDINYAQIALDWHHRLISLGYPSHQVVIVAADEETLSYFQQQNTNSNSTSNPIMIEPMLHPHSAGWPVASSSMKNQVKRRRIFSTRWVYVLHQLQHGHSVLLTDADNIFVRYLDTRELEESGYHVIHAYCYSFPVRFLSMGFTVCGGMVWLKGNDVVGTSEEVDGPAVKYVKSILEQCKWSGIENGVVKNFNGDTIHNNHSESSQLYNISNTYSAIHPTPLKAPAAQCDDQQVINSKFFTNTLNYTWDTRRPNNLFWKQETSGQSLVTGHRFKFWDVDTAYRGPVDGYNYRQDAGENNVDSIESRQACPDVRKNWVAMPGNTIGVEDKRLSAAEERMLRVKQWYQFCRNETID